ncbi:MAG TPA: hypothetical protein VMD47_01440 [Candidatus Acidoferrales bacterium]|nr:hypothetical protein [Candidatus Acidoferrales bacterium]
MLILTDDVGILQHARETVPDRSHGYCTDDVTRALIVMLVRLRQNSERDAMRLASTYLAFLRHAQLDDGRFHNFMSYERTWLDETGGQDSFGRAIWALGYTLRYAPRKSWRRLAAAMLDRALTHAERLEFPRSQAYAMLGLAHAVDAKPTPERTQLLRSLAQSLATLYERERSAEWEWFEPMMTYDNARLPEALLRAAAALGDDHLQTIGRRTLGFLERVVFEDGIFVPVGNDGWLRRGGPRARFAQQPLEAAAMVDAELAACDVSFKSAKAAHRAAARAAAAWFDGKNLLGIRMAHGGGCYDGLERNGPNRNMGAESTLAYLAAAGRIQE